MKRLRNHLIGIDQGNIVLFSDFENGGDMWTGRGPRDRRKHIAFSEPFRTVPTVHVGITMWDVDNETPLRADVAAEDVAPDGFQLVFRTWGDTRVARVRITWMALGELRQVDDWDLY
ncbi:H-type lectin domain-containing protein [Tateyamaria pelophila]|uniref:H-type lectin domain-containing protein n=1 Tax=Tateyamaria pelophila TaxID=328415 RepID=UPI001CBB0F39|nr:H-type lectin domain-containing protein [Tateyamaria pelophila]